MKAIYHHILSAVVMLTAGFVSCTKEQSTQVGGEDLSGNDKVTVNFVAGSELAELTKTYISGADNYVFWNETGEAVKVVEIIDGGTPSIEEAEAVVSEAGKKAVFSPSFDRNDTGTKYGYYTFYPASSFKGTDGTSVELETKISQWPASLTTFDSGADLLIAKPIELSEQASGDMNIRFARLAAVGKIEITGLPEGTVINQVTFHAPGKQLVGTAEFDLVTGEMSSFAGADYVDMFYDAEDGFTSGATAVFTCYPEILSEGDTFNLMVYAGNIGYKKTVTLDEGQNVIFKAGESSRITVDMASAKRIYKVNGVELEKSGDNYVGTVDFVKDGNVSLWGFDNMNASVVSPDFFTYENGTLTYIRDSNKWGLLYSPQHNFFWLTNFELCAPDCLYILGNGKISTSRWIPSIGYWKEYFYWYDAPYSCISPSIGEGQYQATMYLSTDTEDYWDVRLEIYSDSKWNKTNLSLESTSLTGPDAGMFEICSPGTNANIHNLDSFKDGYFRFIITENAEGPAEINITRLSD